MRAFAVQHDIDWEDQPSNCRRVSELFRTCPPEAGSLLILPEMFATGFSMNPSATVATVETMDFLCRLSCEYESHLLAGVVTTDEAGNSRNEAMLWNPDGSVAGSYVKQKGFTLGGEHLAYATGDSHIILDWNGRRVAPFICYDLRFPELFRPAAVDGVELIVVIASWPDKRIQHWRHLLRARAIENQCYVIGVNRVGADPTLNYDGQSLVIDYHGEVVAEGGESEKIIATTLNFEAQCEYRTKLPFLGDMKKKSAE